MAWGGGGVSSPINKSSTATDISPASTTLTDAYTGWVGDWVTVKQAQYARLLLTYGTGDSTTIELKVDVEDGTGTDGFTALRVLEGVASIDQVQITPAGASATERYALQLFIPECRQFRIRAKKTGGSGTVTLAIEYLVDTADDGDE